ncbi:191_t:CDS:2, partial [Racocetra persica]
NRLPHIPHFQIFGDNIVDNVELYNLGKRSLERYIKKNCKFKLTNTINSSSTPSYVSSLEFVGYIPDAEANKDAWARACYLTESKMQKLR